MIPLIRIDSIAKRVKGTVAQMKKSHEKRTVHFWHGSILATGKFCRVVFGKIERSLYFDYLFAALYFTRKNILFNIEEYLLS